MSPTPATLALRDRVQAVLRDAEGFPLLTGMVAKAVGSRREPTYRALCALSRFGLAYEGELGGATNG